MLTINLQSFPTVLSNRFYELAGLDPQIESLATAIGVVQRLTEACCDCQQERSGKDQALR